MNSEECTKCNSVLNLHDLAQGNTICGACSAVRDLDIITLLGLHKNFLYNKAAILHMINTNREKLREVLK